MQTVQIHFVDRVKGHPECEELHAWQEIKVFIHDEFGPEYLRGIMCDTYPNHTLLTCTVTYHGDGTPLMYRTFDDVKIEYER
jgi:hypothetical protein